MSRLHTRLASVLAWIIAAGTVAAIAFSAGPGKVWHTLLRMQPEWFALALGAELVAYVGYVAAYRSSAHAPTRPRLPVLLTVRLVVAGFGPFVPLGGFALDRRALRAVHRDDRAARVHVLGLGVIEYALLAPAAWVCALILLLDRGASPALTLPWVLAVPPGFALGAWLSGPRFQRRWRNREGKLRAVRSDIVAGLAVLRRIAAHPGDHPGAILGMAVYWAAEILCLGAALRCFGVTLGVPALVVAHATGYAASRRSLPLGGAGITEGLLTLALIWVHVAAPAALLSVGAYRLVNFLAPTLPGLLAHSSISPLLRGRAEQPPDQGGSAEERLSSQEERLSSQEELETVEQHGRG